MVGFKISGVVRAARRAHERVQQGIPADERAAFLSGLATTVAHVEALCAKNGATPRDLPAPSRRARRSCSRRTFTGRGRDRRATRRPGRQR